MLFTAEHRHLELLGSPRGLQGSRARPRQSDSHRFTPTGDLCGGVLVACPRKAWRTEQVRTAGLVLFVEQKAMAGWL